MMMVKMIPLKSWRPKYKIFFKFRKKKCFNVLTFLELQNFVYISSPFILARGRDVWPSCVLSICILWPWFRGANDAVLVLTRNTFVYLYIWNATVTWKEYLSSWTYLTKVFHEISFSIVFLAFGSRYSRMDQVKLVEDSLSKIRSDMVCIFAFVIKN